MPDADGERHHSILCPVADGQAPHDLLLSDPADAALAGQVERGLSASARYRIARALGQIGPVRVLSADSQYPFAQ